MKFLYTTDLHGSEEKYATVLIHALENGIDLIHLGADILPKGPDLLSIQKKFIKGFLKKFYEKCASSGIKILASFGNDDVYTRKKYFLEYGELLDKTPFVKDGYEFSAYSFVPDYPFPLKTACKLDSKEWVMKQPFLGKPIDVDEKGVYEIKDPEYFTKKGTIADDLETINPSPLSIMSIHCPPVKLGLDVCINYVCSENSGLPPKFVFFCDKLKRCNSCKSLKQKQIKVGSEAIYQWILRRQPLLILSGHIHESHHVTGKWRGKIGGTTVIQPGQLKPTTLVTIEINGKDVKATRVEIF